MDAVDIPLRVNTGSRRVDSNGKKENRMQFFDLEMVSRKQPVTVLK